MQLSYNPCNRTNFEAVEEALLYSASLDERATVGYFLALHVTRFVPKNMEKLLVDLLLSTLDAQSAFENATSCR